MSKKIAYVSAGDSSNIINPNLEFESEEGYNDCYLRFDHITLGYFCTSTGALVLLPLECGPGWANYPGSDDEDVAYLEKKGVKLLKEDHHYGPGINGEPRYTYRLIVENS